MDLWLWIENGELIVKSFRTKYEIKNGNIVMELKRRFPGLSQIPICVKEELMLCKTENQNLDFICKKIYESVKKSIYSQHSNSIPEKINLRDEKTINLCVYESKRKMLEMLDANKDFKLRVIFPIEDGCAAIYASKLDIQSAINKYAICNKNKIDSILINLGIAKAKQLQAVDDMISFTVIKNESFFMREKYIFKDIALCGYEKTNHLDELNLIDSNDINEELNLLSQLFEKMNEYILSYGFDSYCQIPYKISNFKYKISGKRYVTFATGREPGEVYVRSLKLGIADLLAKHTKKQRVKWVLAQTRLDVMLEAVLPLIFDKLIEEQGSILKIENYQINDCQDVVVNLLQCLEEKEVIPISVQCISIENTILKAGILTILDDRRQQIRCYGVDKKQIISSLLAQYYALYIQNNQYLKEIEQDQIIRIGNDLDIYGEKEHVLFEKILKEVKKMLIEMEDYELEILEWGYNQFLEPAHMKCFKVELKDREGIL